MKLQPQPGPQEQFLRSSADIAIYGGAAGGGKSFALLLEPLYHAENKRFRAVIFRRTIPMIRQQGGLWDTSGEVYPALGATPHQNDLKWRFPSGATVQFAGLEHESDRFNWQGSQIPLIAFDELAEFTEKQFWFLLSRSRSMSGVPGYIRATTNPDPESWVRDFLGWWIDDETGLPITERAGVLRWFVRLGDELFWAESRDELVERFGPDEMPRSVTFIPSSVQDNKVLLESDPSYVGNLRALPMVERERLLSGNWNVRDAAGGVFRREWFEVVDRPPEAVGRVRFWDRAATPKAKGKDPDATVGVLLSRTPDGVFVVEDVQRLHDTALQVEKTILKTAQHDPPGTRIRFMQDPGSAGKGEAEDLARKLAGYDVRFRPAEGDKLTLAKPVSAQAEAGNVKLVRGRWNEPFLRELEGFPDARHDDQVDALSGAFSDLVQRRPIFVA